MLGQQIPEGGRQVGHFAERADRLLPEVGDHLAAAVGLLAVGDGEFAEHALRRLYPLAGAAHLIGITGPPGAGKSTLVSALIEGLGLMPKVAFGPLRVAITGRRVSPPLFESVELLGRERTLARIDAALA